MQFSLPTCSSAKLIPIVNNQNSLYKSQDQLVYPNIFTHYTTNIESLTTGSITISATIVFVKVSLIYLFIYLAQTKIVLQQK